MEKTDTIITYPLLLGIDTPSSNDIVQHDFILDCLESSSADLWQSVYIKHNGEWKVDMRQVIGLASDINRCLLGVSYLSGKSFSHKDLIMGDLYTYFLQYLASLVFGDPHIFEPFQNRLCVKKQIQQIPNIITTNLVNPETIKHFSNILPTTKDKMNLLFEPGNIIEFHVQINCTLDIGDGKVDTLIFDKNAFNNNVLRPTIWKMRLLLS